MAQQCFHFSHTRFIQNTHKLQGNSVRILSAGWFQIFKKKKKKKLTTMIQNHKNGHFDKTFIISRSYIKYCRLIKQLDCWPICTNGGEKCCKHKMFVQITAVVGKKLLRDRSLQNYQHQHIETYKIYKCTFFCPNWNMHFGSIIQNPSEIRLKNKLRNISESKVEFTK